MNVSVRRNIERYRARSVSTVSTPEGVIGYAGDDITSWERQINGTWYDFAIIKWNQGRDGWTVRVTLHNTTIPVGVWNGE